MAHYSTGTAESSPTTGTQTVDADRARQIDARGVVVKAFALVMMYRRGWFGGVVVVVAGVVLVLVFCAWGSGGGGAGVCVCVGGEQTVSLLLVSFKLNTML